MQLSTNQQLSDRAANPDGLKQTVTVSLVIHALVIIALLFSPDSWLSGEANDAALDIMTLRLGGPEGPGEGGLTPLGSRPIQEIVPLQDARRPQWIQPPTPTPPKMILPVPAEEARTRPEPETDVQTTPDEARGRTPTRGSELREGRAMAESGVEGMGIGLSAGGLGGSGTELDVGDFCCPSYLATMLELIRRRWDNNQQVPGMSIVRFTIQRDGSLTDVGLHQGSGQVALDLSAQRAVILTRAIQPLPSAFPGTDLTVRLTFEYRQQ